METELQRRRFTADEYHRMAEAGVLRPDDRVELVDGEIVEMTPIGSHHAACVDRLNVVLLQRCAKGTASSGCRVRSAWTPTRSRSRIFQS